LLPADSDLQRRQLVERDLAVASKRQAGGLPTLTNSTQLFFAAQQVALVVRDVAPSLLDFRSIVVMPIGLRDKWTRDTGLNGHLAATR
jgi:hypothetical protein